MHVCVRGVCVHVCAWCVCACACVKTGLMNKSDELPTKSSLVSIVSLRSKFTLLFKDLFKCL